MISVKMVHHIAVLPLLLISQRIESDLLKQDYHTQLIQHQFLYKMTELVDIFKHLPCS